MQTVNDQIRRVLAMPDLKTLRSYVNDLGRDRAFAARVGQLRLSKDWKDVGALKAELRDLWVQERNSLAKRVVQDVEQQRKVRK